METIKILPDEFSAWKNYIYSISGISLDETKSYLLESRFSSLINKLQVTSFSELFMKVKSDYSKTLQREIIDLITTRETLFFRDSSPFEVLQHKIIPDLIDIKTKVRGPNRPLDFKIWSAASSTGQEIYSISIVLKELFGDLTKHNIKLVGTDISDQAIAAASKGYFNKVEIDRGLGEDQRRKYFTEEGERWKIKDELRSVATFKQLNLHEDFSSLGKFDIIFCRNVAIYFTETDKINLFNRIGKMLEPNGYLIIGSTESITGICHQYEAKRHIRCVYYQLKP